MRALMHILRFLVQTPGVCIHNFVPKMVIFALGTAKVKLRIHLHIRIPRLFERSYVTRHRHVLFTLKMD